MSSNNYQIYINQTLQLAETIVIKSSYAAEALNELVRGLSGYSTSVDPDPATWKYYLNLAGEYHSIDQVMKVVSMDTLNEILFTKDNLKIHRATARAYEYGTRQYTELVAKYPQQEQLILGILYPTDIQKAIAAKDGEILSYPAGLVEVNEYTLIPRIQKWIYHYKQRWYIPGFDYTDELYSATMLGQMHALLIQAILTERTAACNTNEAHSFHVRQFLGSHGYLDQYMDTLTTSQALYFYRNIQYIERHAGRNSTFDTLTEHIMTERFVPLAEYTMKHDVEKQAEELYPQVMFKKRQLNLGIVLAENNATSIEQMLSKELPLAKGNSYEIGDTAAQMRELMENSSSNVVATKALESTMTDESNSSPQILSETLFNHWLYLSSQGLYVAYININNPQTGEKLPLTAKEAFVLAMYAYAKSIDRPLKTIPLAYASRVQRLPTPAQPDLPSVDDIYSIVDHKLIPRSVAELALSQQPLIPLLGPLISIDAFYSLALDLDNAMQMQRRLIASQEHYEARGMVVAMVSRIYADHIIELEPQGTLYDTWLSERNIDLSNFNQSDFELLYTDIVGQATGETLHPTMSMRELQRSMVEMFTQLSSYGIQVIREINDEAIRKTDWPGVRLGKADGELADHIHNPSVSMGVERVGQELAAGILIDMNHPMLGPEIHQYGEHSVHVELGLNGDMVPDITEYNIVAPLARLGVIDAGPKIDLPRGWVDFFGVEYFLKLTPEQIAVILDPVNGDTTYTPPGKIPLSQIILDTELKGIIYDERNTPIASDIKNTLLGKIWPK